MGPVLVKTRVTIFQKTWKTSFWAHFITLWPRNLKIKFSPKKSFQSILSLVLHSPKTSNEELFYINLKLICYNDSIQKSEKFWAQTSDKTHKNSDWVRFGPFLHKIIKAWFFSKRLFESVSGLYATITLYKKIRKKISVNLSNLKNLILDPFWSLLAQKPQNKIFPKKVNFTKKSHLSQL